MHKTRNYSSKELLINLKYLTMKNIYLSMAALALSGVMFGQNIGGAMAPSLNTLDRKAGLNTVSTNSDRSIDYQYWIEPIGDMMYNKGIKISSKDNPRNQTIYLAPLFADSTAKICNYNANETVFYNYVGSVLDLNSYYLKPTADGSSSGGIEPVITKNDPYTIDSLDIWASYNRAPAYKSLNDTLYIWLVWGDTANTAVWKKRYANESFSPWISSWRAYDFGLQLKGNGPGTLAAVSPAAPSTNVWFTKHVLTAKDTAKPQFSNDVYVKVGQLIPAGNIVSCFYTYVPNKDAHTVGGVFYAFMGPNNEPPLNPAQTNGFAADVWQQSYPVVTAKDSSYLDHQVDPTPGNKSTGLRVNKNGRYNISTIAGNNTSAQPTHITGTVVNYKVKGKSTVGILEQNENFSLGQNAPNPFNGETTIAYNLKSSAKNVSFYIYNISGVRVFEKSQLNPGAGSYSLEFSKSNLAAGIYFYTLNVDGHRLTRKMVITE